MIYVGIPVHNEQHTAGVLLWSIRKVLVEEGWDFRLVVVDDASTDRTAEVLEPYRRVLPLTLLQNEQRRGYAASLERIVREVLEASDYHKRDGLLTLEADFTNPPEVIPEMIRHFQSGADLVQGVPVERRSVPRWVELGRLGARFLLDSLPTPEEVRAPLCGFRYFRLFLFEEALSDLAAEDEPLLRHDGWAANAELLAAVWPHVRQMDEVEFSVDYSRRYRKSRFRPLSELWNLYRAGRDDRLRRARPELRAEGRAS